MSSADSVVTRAMAEMVGPPATLILDLAGVGFCDSAGINGLARIRRQCEESGWSLRIINLQPNVRRVIVDLTGLGEFLGVADETGS